MNKTKSKTPKKWKIGWGYTSACNMNCPFCYSKTVRHQPEEIDLDTANRFMDNNHRLIESINYGTGECPLSINWFKFIKGLRQKYPGISQALTTNGSIYNVVKDNDEKRDIFSAAIDEVDVSLDFADPDKHNSTRGHQQAYEGVIDTLELCASQDKITTIVFVAYEDTIHSQNIEALFQLAASYNTFVRVNILRPTPGINITPLSYRSLFSTIRRILENHKVVSLCDPLFGSLFDSVNAAPDASGVTSLRILPDGSITPSTYLVSEDWRSANLKSGVCLSRASLFPSFKRLTRGTIIPEACSGCPLVDTCRGGAVDRRILYYNTLLARDPFCPKRNDDYLPTGKSPVYYSPDKGTAPLAHDGYLPTLIFAP